jgi:FkbM family methyltransferase
MKRLVKAALPFLPAFRWRARKELEMASAEARHVGWPAAVRLAASRWFGRAPAWLTRGQLGRVKLAGFRHPLYFRDRSSDPLVIHQVFALREYEAVAAEPAVRYVLDLGANIGCASFVFLHRYPEARVVVVEPDAGNMAVCRRNLAPFGDRVRYVQAGVWSSSEPMVVERGAFRDGAEWSFQVRPARPGETPDFQAKTVGDLIAEAGFPRVDLLKVDIEAAEAEVFRRGAAWLSEVRTVVVELHGPRCEDAVSAALAASHRLAGRSGELSVYRRSTSP